MGSLGSVVQKFWARNLPFARSIQLRPLAAGRPVIHLLRLAESDEPSLSAADSWGTQRRGNRSRQTVAKYVGLITHFRTQSHQIRLKSSGETFYGTHFAPHKTCLTTVVC